MFALFYALHYFMPLLLSIPTILGFIVSLFSTEYQELNLYGNAILRYMAYNSYDPSNITITRAYCTKYTEEIRSDMQEIWSRLLYRTILLYGIGYYVNESCL